MDDSSTDPPTPFAALGLRRELTDALAALGYEEPTPIQLEAIPPVLAGRDLLGRAATGTGKTAAFALPVLERLAADAERDRAADGAPPAALVLVPTRELALQVSEAVHKYGRGLGARVVPIYGGQPFGRQVGLLKRGTDVVVATPGRALDHLRRGTLPLDGVRTVVLDEADEMLDMGFADDLEAILDATPERRQTVLFSATMPPRIDAIARRRLRDPVHVEIERELPAAGEAPRVREVAYVVPRAHKAAALARILDVESPEAAIVFCRTRDQVDTLTETMTGRGHRAEALHGGMTQDQRDRVMRRLRAGTTELLVATDVAARGLDVEQLTHVVNHDVPSAPEAYVHRIGRVGRAGRAGVAITLAEPREHRMLRTIERVTGRPIAVERVPTVADLHARRLEVTRAALEERLAEAEANERFRVVVDSLSDEHDVVEIALAALRLAHEATGGDAAPEPEIPDVAPGRERRPAPERRDRRERHDREGRGRREDRGAGGREERPARRPPRRGGAPSEDTTRIFVGAGRAAGVRPQDLVGAITGESALVGRDIGAIEISERFSLVEVPATAVDDVITALRGTTIKGKRATIRRERY